MAAVAFSSTTLQHKYISLAGHEQGSISASIFTSEDGNPSGRWKATQVYQQTEVTDTRPDEQKYARYEGYIESTPDRYFGIVLQWRSKTGALTKTWKLDDDLVAYYYIDGRPLPCMRYAIYQPGGKNPLPLSCLWPDNTNRYSLKWIKRDPARENVKPTDELFTSTDESSPIPPPLTSVDDFSSIRITLHHKTDEEASKYKHSDDFDESPMPRNLSTKKKIDPNMFKDRALTEAVGLNAPEDVPHSILEEIFSGREAPPKALPFLEFRLHYKNKETLQALGIMPADSLPASIPNGRALNGHADSQEGSTSSGSQRVTNGHNGVTSVPAKRPRESEIADQLAASGSRLTNGTIRRSSSPLPPPLRAQPANPSVPPNATNGHQHRSTSTASDNVSEPAAAPPSKRVKAEPHSSPNRMRAPAVVREDEISSNEENVHENGQASDRDNNAAHREGNDALPSPPPMAEQSQQSTSAFFETQTQPQPQMTSTKIAHPAEQDRNSTPSTSTAAVPAPAKAEHVSPRTPSLAQRAGLQDDSPMPSPSQLTFGSQSQSQSQSSVFPPSSQNQGAMRQREEDALAFLAEDDLDIAEPENAAALVSVGFRTKKRFLAQLPKCEQAQRDKIFADLAAKMEPLDYGVLRHYLLEKCNLKS